MAARTDAESAEVPSAEQSLPKEGCKFGPSTQCMPTSIGWLTYYVMLIRSDFFWTRNLAFVQPASPHSAKKSRRAAVTRCRWEVEMAMMKDEMACAATIGKWKDRWMRHPLPNSAEPLKAICYLTNFEDYDEDYLANLFLKATLHPIDRFFMLLRRRVNMLERSIGTASKAGRQWHGYSAYQPANIEKLLEIFRIYYNFSAMGKDQKTPAMRLGLAERAYSKAELLNMA